MKAGIALVELGWDGGGHADPVELIPILDQLCKTTDDPSRLRGYLIQRSRLALEVGERTNARAFLARAVELDPEQIEPRRDLAHMLFEAQQWVKARQVMETLLVDEDLLPRDVAIELHHRVARCAREVGDIQSAQKHVDIALVLQPDHRPSLLLRTELGQADPHQLVADQLALASTAPPEERATRFAAIGDRYMELGDRPAAREMYREAIQYRPGDHLLLTKFLELVADDGDWSYSLDVVRKLIASEKDPKVRARYKHLAGATSSTITSRQRSCSLLRSRTIHSRSRRPTSSRRCSSIPKIALPSRRSTTSASSTCARSKVAPTSACGSGIISASCSWSSSVSTMR
jgi:tetratricopeptide (TPR) repeat protein